MWARCALALIYSKPTALKGAAIQPRAFFCPPARLALPLRLSAECAHVRKQKCHFSLYDFYFEGDLAGDPSVLGATYLISVAGSM